MATFRRATTLADYFPILRRSTTAQLQPNKSFNPRLAQQATAKQKGAACSGTQQAPGPSGSATVRGIPQQNLAIRQIGEAAAFPPLPNQIPKTHREAPQPTPPLDGPKRLTKSFREAVSAQWSDSVDVSLPPSSNKVLSSYMGEPALCISEEEEARLAKSFQFALIGKFSRGRPTMETIRKVTMAAGFSGECHVGLIDYRHVIFQFQLQDDFLRMWMKTSWTFGGFLAKIFRWSPEFCPEKESSIMPVWITFPLLPVHLCNKEMLFALGTAVGTPLKLDLATAAMVKVLRPSTARLCVEVDLLNDLPNRVWIEQKGKGKWQPIVYENLPDFCSSCFKIGHPNSKCKPLRERLKDPLAKVWVPKMNNQVQNGGPSGEFGIHEPSRDVAGLNKQMEKDSSEVMRVEEKSGKQETVLQNQQQPLENGNSNLDRFLANLGQVLEIINRREESPETLHKTEESSLAISTEHIIEESNRVKIKTDAVDHALTVVVGSHWNQAGRNLDSFFTKLGQFMQFINRENRETARITDFPPLPSAHTKVLCKGKGKESEDLEPLVEVSALEGRLVASWDDGSLLSPTTDLDILQVDPTEIWDEGEPSNMILQNERLIAAQIEEVEYPIDELYRLFPLQFSNKKKQKSNINVNAAWEEGEPSTLHRVSSSSNLRSLHSEGEDEDDGQWTENSFEEEPADAFDSFLDKMESCRKPYKPTKNLDALLSPKISDYSGRKLRDRNPRICYSERKKWS